MRFMVDGWRDREIAGGAPFGLDGTRGNFCMSDLFLHSDTKLREGNRAPDDEVVNAFNGIRDHPSLHGRRHRPEERQR